jgi:hypothetical protein
MSDAQKIELLLRECEEATKKLPSEALEGPKGIKGDAEMLEELRQFMNTKEELVSDVKMWARLSASGDSGHVVTILGSISAVATVLSVYFKTKQRKMTIHAGKKKLTCEGYSPEEIGRVLKAFDAIHIEK